MLQAGRLRIVDGALIAFGIALVGRAAWVQLWQGERWERMAESQHYARSSIPAPRGEIRDVTGVALARSEVTVHLNVVPPNVKEPRRLQRDLERLGVDRATRRRVADRNRKWVPIRKAFLPSEVVAVSAMKGVVSTPNVQRDYLPGDGLRPIVGRTSVDGEGLDGMELLLDSLLRGERGSTRALLGARGQRYESLDAMSRPPRPGHTVTLTISNVLQDICDRALDDAHTRLRITGGDIVVLDPQRGELRCLASLRPGGTAKGSPALVDPFEPGSTLKPFFAGRMVEAGQARLDELVETFDGVYRSCGRTITDVHRAERLSLSQVIQHSSNVGIARFTERLSRQEVFETLRDWGFGSMTGISYPSESSGLLKEPAAWSCPTQASVSMGYEIAVTPLQLASAYAAIANDGLLLVPTLVRSIVDADGDVVYEHRPQVIRRVIQPGTARALREVLASVVDSGTSTDASLSTFDLGGKSGTARRVIDGRYQSGRYSSTFVGLFPARDPQFVILVKLDDPQGAYYGGKTAAPVAKAVLEAAIAARDALDRGGLATQRVRYVPPAGDVPAGQRPDQRVDAARRIADEASAADDAQARYALVDSSPLPPAVRIRMPVGAAPDSSETGPAQVVVPDVRGLPERVAARELHRAGLRVVFVSNVGYSLSPPPGARVASGSVVKVARR
ncbi:MAG TPA: penicillin-binding transpeptidase domain-containing protein [Gemmatimonadaceae bacterium]